MMKNEFYDIMNAHSDEQLIEIYTNRSQYTDEAVEAIELVLKERNLSGNAVEADEIKQKEESLTKEDIYNKFQRAEFGKVISDTDFTQEKLINSVYFQRYISPLHNYNWLNHLFIILGIIGLVLTLIIIGIGEFYPPVSILLALSVFFAALLPLGIWKLRKNKAQISIRKEMRAPVLQITGIKDDHEMQLPIRYLYYWEWHHIKLTLKQVQLSLFLFDDNNNTVIELRELIELHKSPPPHWEELPKAAEIKSLIADKTLYTFLNHGIQKPFLYELQKILSGLDKKQTDC